jgi:hypothetical protein
MDVKLVTQSVSQTAASITPATTIAAKAIHHFITIDASALRHKSAPTINNAFMNLTILTIPSELEFVLLNRFHGQTVEAKDQRHRCKCKTQLAYFLTLLGVDDKAKAPENHA